MDADNAPARQAAPVQGGTVEPANRAPVAIAKFQTPEPEPGERYELRDPFAEVTYRANTFPEMVAKADQLGSTRFVAVSEDGKRTPIQRVDGAWQRGEQRPAPPERPLDPGPTRDEVPEAASTGPTPVASKATAQPEQVDTKAVAKIDAQAEHVARQRPDVVDQHAVDPRVALLELEHHGGRPEAPVLVAEHIVGVGRQLRDRAHAPDQPARAGAGGRQEGRELDVAEAEGAALAGNELRLPDQRHDRARDDVPVLVHLDRDHRLDVEDVLRPRQRPDVEVGVVLERHADQVADRVLRQLGEFLGRHLSVGRRCECATQRSERQRGAHRPRAGGDVNARHCVRRRQSSPSRCRGRSRRTSRACRNPPRRSCTRRVPAR